MSIVLRSRRVRRHSSCCGEADARRRPQARGRGRSGGGDAGRRDGGRAGRDRVAAAGRVAGARPRPHGGPDGRLAVAGPWLRALDPDDAGELAGWAAGHFPGRSVAVPNVANAAKITGAAGVAAHRGGIAWYRTTLTAPRTGSFALRFESVHHVAQVWLDGQLLGTHTGVYLPFEFTLRLREGVPHRLVVKADYRFPSRQKREGWHRTWFNYGGINREVTLRPLGRSELQAPALRTRPARAAHAARPSTSSVIGAQPQRLGARHCRCAARCDAVAGPAPAARLPEGARRGWQDAPGVDARGDQGPGLVGAGLAVALRARSSPWRARAPGMPAWACARSAATAVPCCSTASACGCTARRSTRTPRATETR